ncbi:ArsR family transcriptional regulator [Fontibacillus phaseoli]|uniref:ArsR family transcriptional regulator n=1 Tax=Fontibacillus phaseoli TaxID=1416533 RepID=A0A369BQ93_9BACL|nr:helix-turn-helix domain-containing protein [Fontibacillus phaseoli]RCX23571.1 ArsR family transcriptional regulator [Fontibacillus phaseoli]
MYYDVKIDVSPVYELLSSFIIYTTRKWVNNLDVGSEWIQSIEARLDEKERQSFAAAAELPFSDYDLLYALILERKPDAEIDQFLTELAETDGDSLLHILKSYIRTVNSEDISRLRSYVPLLRIWNDLYFRHIENQYVSLLEEDAAEKQALMQKMDPDALLEYASGGLVLEPQLPIEKVVLLPSIHFRPINTYCFYENTLLIQYPLDLPEQDENEPPICLLRLTRALVKPERLRLLRYVADEPKSLQDLAQNLHESEEQLMHHLMRLRVAGLLRIHLVDRDTEKFSIRPDGASELQMFLESYIRL